MHSRSDFNSSRLVRMLSDWAPVDARASRQNFAERLGQWVGVTDAITLHAAHQSIRLAGTARPSAARSVRAFAVEEEFHRVQDALVGAITTSDLSAARTHAPEPQAAPEMTLDYAPYHERYLHQQRNMASMIHALRDHVRQTISKVSPALAQLAVLDAVMEQMLDERQQQLLSAVPVLLLRRFKDLREQHKHEPDATARTAQWLEVFGKEWREALLAELDVRLEPVVGMIEAFNEIKK